VAERIEVKMTNKDQKINYKAFIPTGITFIGAGIAFMAAVNPGIGAGLIAVGVIFVVIGAIKTRSERSS